MRLHARLVFLVGIAAGPALGLLSLSQSASHEYRVAHVERRAQDLALSAAIHADARIQSLRQVVAGFGAMLPRLESDRLLCTETAERLAGGFGHVGFAIVSYRNEGAPCGHPRAAAALADIPNPQASDAPAPTISEYGEFRRGKPGEIPDLALVKTVVIDRQIAGAAVASASVEWLTENLGHLPLGPAAMVMLIDREGYVLARRPDASAWLGRRISDSVLDDIRNRRLDGRQNVLGLSDRPLLAASMPLSSVPGPLFIVAGLDHDAEFGPILRARAIDLAVLGLLILAILATAIGSWSTARVLVRREKGLHDAKAAVERLAAGQQRIADTIGHDLRNSVQTLVSFLRNLRRNGDRPPDPAMMPYVARAIGDLRSALDVLVRASRLESNALEPRKRTIALATFLKKIENDWQFFADTKGLALNVTPGRESVHSDPDLLRTIVSNLVSNAIKHTTRGSVHVTSRTEPDGRIAIVVRDTGDGIPPDKAKVIFDAFSRLEPEKTEGLGLGLSICKRSADLLGCQLSLDPNAEGGACFVVRLPAAP